MLLQWFLRGCTRVFPRKYPSPCWSRFHDTLSNIHSPIIPLLHVKYFSGVSNSRVCYNTYEGNILQNITTLCSLPSYPIRKIEAWRFPIIRVNLDINGKNLVKFQWGKLEISCPAVTVPLEVIMIPCGWICTPPPPPTFPERQYVEPLLHFYFIQTLINARCVMLIENRGCFL